MNSCAKIGCGVYIFTLIIIGLSGFAIFSLEVAKIILFKSGGLQINIIDYVYLIYLICGFVYGGCCSTRKDNCANILAFFLSIIIYVLYVCLTINEMDDIPFFCPENYPYSTPLIRKACQVRAANLLLLWIIPGILLIIALFACCYYSIHLIAIYLHGEKPNQSNNV